MNQLNPLFINWRRLFLVSFFTFSGFFYALCLRAYYVGFFNDDAYYLIGAHSLAQGTYVELNHPEKPPLVNYMPGYPALLAPFTYIFKEHLSGYQILSIFFTLGILLLILKIDFFSQTPELLLPLFVVLALNPLIVSQSGVVLSDIPFALFLLLQIFLTERYWKRESLQVWVLLGLLAGFLFLIRPVGALWPFVVGLFLLFSKRHKVFFIFSTTFLLVILPWFIWTKMTRGYWLFYGVEYSSQYSEGGAIQSGIKSILWNVPYYLDSFFNWNLFRFSFLTSGLIKPVFYSLCVGVSLLGTWRVLQTKNKITQMILLFVGLYLSIHLGWHRQAGRYLIPILPFMYYIFFSGLFYVLQKFRFNTKGIILFVSLILFSFLPPWKKMLDASLYQNTSINTPPITTVSWIKENIGNNEVISCETEASVFLLTGKKTRHFPKGLSDSDFLAWNQEKKVNYILLSDPSFFLTTQQKNTVHDPLIFDDYLTFMKTSPFLSKVFESTDEKTQIWKINY